MYWDHRIQTKIRRLLEQWTRAEVAARTAQVSTSLAGELYQAKIDTEDRMRRLLFGTDDLYELARLFEMKTNKKMGSKA